ELPAAAGLREGEQGLRGAAHRRGGKADGRQERRPGIHPLPDRRGPREGGGGFRRRTGQHDPLILFPEYELIKMKPIQHSCYGLISYKNPHGAAHREDHNAGNQLRAMAAASMAIISSSLVGMLPSGPRPAGAPGPFYARAK